MIERSIRLSARGRWFLFGPRQTGKSTLVQGLLGPKDLYFNLLPRRDFLNYAKDPGRFREEVLQHSRKHAKFTCAVDEIQRIPPLLDEVHDLIERLKIRFILTGSSARKLRRGGANLLAGRAYSLHLFPLTFEELGERFSLERALRIGLLPALWDPGRSEDEREFLRSYAETYLKEEIQEEGIVRRVGPFTRFLDIAAANDGLIVNYSTVARDCGVSVKTVQEYYAILEDTFIAAKLEPWARSARKRMVAHPKYYFFDPGVTNALCHMLGPALNPIERGRRFEQLVILQAMALIEYGRLDLKLSFWRTHTGGEVDLILSRGGKIVAAAEIKSTDRISSADCSGLRSFVGEHPKVPAYVLGPELRPREVAPGITAMGWREFLGGLRRLA